MPIVKLVLKKKVRCELQNQTETIGRSGRIMQWHNTVKVLKSDFPSNRHTYFFSAYPGRSKGQILLKSLQRHLSSLNTPGPSFYPETLKSLWLIGRQAGIPGCDPCTLTLTQVYHWPRGEKGHQRWWMLDREIKFRCDGTHLEELEQSRVSCIGSAHAQ